MKMLVRAIVAVKAAAIAASLLSPPTVTDAHAAATSVEDLTVFDGSLIACGNFDTVGAVFAKSIARWDGHSWNPLPSGPSQYLGRLFVYNGDLIVAGGFFEDKNEGNPFNCIARWDGVSWGALGSGIATPGAMDFVDALAVHEGTLVAGGSFGIIGWDGTRWSGLGSGISGRIYALAVYRGELIAGGRFKTAGERSASNIARWDGRSWRPLGAGVDGDVSCLAVYNHQLIVGGEFEKAGANAVFFVARWDGTSWKSLGKGMGAGGFVRSLVVHNGQLIAGGEFDLAGDASASLVASWDGSSWSALGPGLGSGGGVGGPTEDVRALTVYDGNLIAGGTFRTAAGRPVGCIARWDGVSWQPMGSGMRGGH